MTTTYIPYATFQLVIENSKNVIQGTYTQHQFELEKRPTVNSDTVNKKINSIVYAEDPQPHEPLETFLAHFSWHLN